MKRILISAFLIGLVVFVAGCVENGGGFMGIGAEEEEAPDDVLLVERKSVVPNPPITADTGFEFSFVVRNPHEGTDLDADSAEISLYDSGRCDEDDDNEDWGVDGDETIYAGGERNIRWDFTAPDTDDIGRMPAKCDLRFKVEYDFTASTIHDVILAEAGHMEDLDRRGETIDIAPTQRRGHGPIKIHVDFWQDQPFIARGENDEKEAEFGFSVQLFNRGEGALNTEKTDLAEKDGDLTIKYNDEDITGDCDWPEDELYFIDDSTPKIRCEVTDDDIDGPIQEEDVTVELENYTYTIHYRHEVPVEPR